jgi:hypothetical protein
MIPISHNEYLEPKDTSLAFSKVLNNQGRSSEYIALQELKNRGDLL